MYITAVVINIVLPAIFYFMWKDKNYFLTYGFTVVSGKMRGLCAPCRHGSLRIAWNTEEQFRRAMIYLPIFLLLVAGTILSGWYLLSETSEPIAKVCIYGWPVFVLCCSFSDEDW